MQSNSNIFDKTTNPTKIHKFEQKQKSNPQAELIYINICLVGCVSAGKSTILNAFFGQDYAQCKIKRTTMMPNKFIETVMISHIDSFETINKTISDVNSLIYSQTEKSTALNLGDYGEELTFYVGNMEMNIGNKIKICIYDIPGLNDARTKNVYYDYLEKNFHKFNMILFVVDIFSGLNTSDEMDILKFLTNNIKKHQTSSNKNIQMLTIVNKADDMQLESNKTLTVLGELGEMFEQVKTTVTGEFNKNKIGNKLLDCIPICGLDAHLYRMIKKFKDVDRLSKENILRIGINEEGSKFRKYTPEEQRVRVQNKIKDMEFVEDMIKLSGFAQIEVCLNHYIGQKGNIMVTENVLLDYSKICPMTIDNIVFNVIQRIGLLNYLCTTNREKHDEEIKNLIKQFNTLVYKKIHTMTCPFMIKIYYDKTIKELTNEPKIKSTFVQFFNTYICPSYLTDRILELVSNSFGKKDVTLRDLLDGFDIVQNVTPLDADVVELMIKSLMGNTRETCTFVFGYEFDTQVLIELFDKLSGSKDFIGFLRFFLANMYTTFNSKTPDVLTDKLMLFTKYNEIPMRQFLTDLRIEKGFYHTKKNIESYCKGINSHDKDSYTLELYYLEKIKPESKNIFSFMWGNS